MIRLSKLADYAIVLMACLAEGPAAQMSAQALAERTRLELPTVAKLLKQLANAAGIGNSNALFWQSVG